MVVEGRATDNSGPALAMLELDDIPLGLVALDAVAKEAPVALVGAGTIHHGHFLIVFAGPLAAVEMSHARAHERSGSALVDAVLLPNAEPRILPALQRGVRRFPAPGDALGMLEARSSPTLVGALDGALKGTPVELVELRLAEGLGGKAVASLWGNQHDVEVALELAEARLARGPSAGASTTLIANAHPEVARVLSAGTRYFKEQFG
ncbi:MAG: BMC domain-containing protein [Polyangiaceae bacterium]|nr:BMC domain-containing protein [Polyangiaceae bacterium]